MRIASLVHPHRGGTFTVHRQLRAGLVAHGHAVEWLAPADLAGAAAGLPEAEIGAGAFVGRAGAGEAPAARALAEAIVTGGYDAVLGHVLGDRASALALRLLPPEVLRALVVHNVTPGTYAAAAALRPHVHAAIGVSPRIAQDLVRRGFAPRTTRAVFNAADIVPLPRSPAPAGGLRLLYLGRLEDAAKGVLWLPGLMRRLPASITLTVAGDGPDRAALERRLAPLRDRATCLGAVAPADLPALLARHDALIAPSRFEGFCLVLAEAMACGCVPVVSRLRGVTDALVADGRDGLLFPVGDMARAAAAIARLAADPGARAAMAVHGAARARELSVARMAQGYDDLLRIVAADPPPVRPALAREDARAPAGLGPGLRRFLPPRLKNALRVARARLA